MPDLPHTNFCTFTEAQKIFKFLVPAALSLHLLT